MPDGDWAGTLSAHRRTLAFVRVRDDLAGG